MKGDAIVGVRSEPFNGLMRSKSPSYVFREVVVGTRSRWIDEEIWLSVRGRGVECTDQNP